jgi:hypothetical protein
VKLSVNTQPPTITSVTPLVVEKGQTTEVGTVTPGVAGDALTLQQTGGSGTLALQLVHGVEEVIYTAPSTVAVNMLDSVSYTITDQNNGAVAAGSNTVPVAPTGDVIYVGAAGGSINVGNGQDKIFAGANDLINLGRGNDTVAFGESPNSTTIGNETINGFNPAQDILQFNPALLSSYSAAHISQVGANTVIQIDPTNSATLDHVTATALTASNFHFS